MKAVTALVAPFSGCIVTIDAMGTQTHIAKTIVEAQADYVLSVKENQGHLLEDISVLFAVDQASDFKNASYEYKKTTNKGHGASKFVNVTAPPTRPTYA